MDYETLIKNLAQNCLTVTERQFIYRLLENSRKAKIALRVNDHFHLGRPLDLTEQGAFVQAGNDLERHSRTAQRNYYDVFPKRSVLIEKPIPPALSFSIG